MSDFFSYKNPELINTIDIVGIPFKVYLADELVAGGEEADGFYRDSEQALIVRRGLPVEYSSLVLLHEALHGVSAAMALDWDESTVERASRAIYGLFTLNPNLFDGLDNDDTYLPPAPIITINGGNYD